MVWVRSNLTTDAGIGYLTNFGCRISQADFLYFNLLEKSYCCLLSINIEDNLNCIYLLRVTFLTEKYRIGLLFVKLNRFPFLKLFKLSVHLNCAATSLNKTINFIYFFSRSLPQKWITGRKVQPEQHGSFKRQIRNWFSNIQDESFLQSECVVVASGRSKCHYSLLCKANQNRRGDLHNLLHNLGLSQWRQRDSATLIFERLSQLKVQVGDFLPTRLHLQWLEHLVCARRMYSIGLDCHQVWIRGRLWNVSGGFEGKASTLQHSPKADRKY